MSPRLAFSSGSYRRAPSAHRRGAEALAGLSSCEMAPDVEDIVGCRVNGKTSPCRSDALNLLRLVWTKTSRTYPSLSTARQI